MMPVLPEKPFVSVIVPNYNYARFLNQRLDTILNQTYQNFELIILDDCSTDNSKDVIESYRSNSHVSHIVYNDVNSGSTFKQWKKGLELAKGDLVWIAEADDYSESTFLEELVPFFVQNQNLGFAFCYSVLVDSKGELYPEDVYHYSGEEYVTYFEGVDFIQHCLLRGNDLRNVSSALFRKQAIESISEDYVDYKATGDRLFYILLSEKFDVVYLNKKLNYYRASDTRVTPRRYADGTTIKESFMIDKYLTEKGYLVGWERLASLCKRFQDIYYGTPFTLELRKSMIKTYSPGFWFNKFTHRILSVLVVAHFRLARK